MIASGAVFSSCKKYRYRLWRTWDTSKPPAIFVLLNPSTADEFTNDPTVERCQVRAMRMGFGGLEILNIFAYRSTDPKALYAVADPVGPDNDAAIMDCIDDNPNSTFICGWGKNGQLSGRAAKVLCLIMGKGKTPHALKLNESDGSPAHPLYLSYGLLPRPMAHLADELALLAVDKKGSTDSGSTVQPTSATEDRGLFNARITKN